MTSNRALSARARHALDVAITGGQHRVDISPDGKVTILPLAVPVAQADDAALDAEIADHLSKQHGDVAH